MNRCLGHVLLLAGLLGSFAGCEREPAPPKGPQAVGPSTESLSAKQPSPGAAEPVSPSSESPRGQQPPPGVAQLAGRLDESFSGPALDRGVWCVTRKNDFQESTIDVVDGRLRLRAATIGTRDDTVKFHGVRTREAFDLSAGAEVAFELDWNDQANGCYLTAGVYLCPTATDANPRDEENWLKFEYIGVPPGKNARALVAVQQQGRLRHLFTEGWPREQRTGRKIGRQRVRLALAGDRLEVWENDRLLFESDERAWGFSQAYLYLQMSSHSNYSPREVYFDNVLVHPPSKE